MKIAIVAPSAVPFSIGGAENLWWGLLDHLNQETRHQAELVKLPSPEHGFWELLASYRRFAEIDLSHFDLVISTKYPAWMVSHPRHVVYLQHRLRGLYDTYALTGLPETPSPGPAELDALVAFARRPPSREALPELFARLDALRDGSLLPEPATRFPGPLARLLVRWLDGVGLARAAVSRWAAISRNVALRRDYFPAGVDPLVLHHPSNLRRFRNTGEEHLFTIARLDRPKRVELLIRAMRHVRAEVPLRIAGTGPEEEALRALAAADRRIEFLGFVPDREVERLYADAIAVLYAPEDEDYGLVPVEAMACGKPVVTTKDAGGPNELVEDGRTGFSVAPVPECIAEAVDSLCNDRDRARALGRAGRERVRGITWGAVVAGLLGELRAGPLIAVPPARFRLAVASSYPIFPAEHGGQVRQFELLRRLAGDFDIEVVALGRAGEAVRREDLGPGLREVCVPPSDAHLRAEEALSRSVDWLPVTDVALQTLFASTPRWMEALASAAARADLVLVAHSYPLPAIEAVSAGRPFCYDAHNVEYDLKRGALGDSEAGRRLLEQVRAVEERCCRDSALVLTCSEEDGARLEELYGLPAGRRAIVPNGVDVATIRYVDPEERRARQRALGLEGVETALFVGSWHPPNIEAVRNLQRIAERRPEMRFLVLGGVGGAFAREVGPPNLGFLGVVDGETKQLVLGMTDVALNPMSWGGGTNLKMLEYCASGLPVLTTECGARGLALRDEEHLEVAPLEAFSERLAALRGRRGEAAARARVERARACVERHYDWDVIAAGLAAALRATVQGIALTDARGSSS